MADTLLSQAAAFGAVTVDVSTTSALTTTQAVAAHIEFVGSLAANATYDLPTTKRAQLIRNDTTGPNDLFVRRGPSGTPYFIPPGETVEVL